MVMRRVAVQVSEASPEVDKQAEIIMRGPLSEVYTKALQELYDNQIQVETDSAGTKATLSAESQAIDVEILGKLGEMMRPEVAPTHQYQLLYGAARNDLNDDTVVDVTKQLNQTYGDGPNNEFVLILDESGNSEGTVIDISPEAQEKAVALECMVHAHKGKVYHSLREYVAQHKRK